MLIFRGFFFFFNAAGMNFKRYRCLKCIVVAQTCVPEQEKSEGAEISGDFDSLSTKELAYHMTLFDWELFWNVHEVPAERRSDIFIPMSVNKLMKLVVFLVRTDILDVRPAPVPTDHGQLGRISQAVQRNTILGHHRNMYVAEHIEKDEHTKKND